MNEKREQEPQVPETGESYHIKAEQAREEGNFLDALKFTDDATVQYQREGNIIKLAEVQSSRFLTLRHLATQTNDNSWLILAKHAAESAVEIMSSNGGHEGVGIPTYNLGKLHEEMGNDEEAAVSFTKSLEEFKLAPSDPQGRPAVIADISARLAIVEYRMGKEEALDRFDTAITDLEKDNTEDSYNKSVWLAGAHMRMAVALKDKHNEKALSEIAKARNIISSDSRLKLRAGQFIRLEQEFEQR